jgi:glutaredoxin
LAVSPEFVIYTRSTCSLCDAMEDELRPFIKEYSITVKRQYIDNDTELEKLYGGRVPVLALNEKIVCEYFLDAEKMRDLLNDS